MIQRQLRFTTEAKENLGILESTPANKGILKQVRKTLGFIETNLKHPSLNVHEFTSMKGVSGEKVFEAYAQNQTPGAYRIFFQYGPDEELDGKRLPILTIIAITPHP